MPEDIKSKFYVYVLRDPRPDKNNQPIYVGKGRGKRAHHHWAGVGHYNQILDRTLSKIRKAGLISQVDIIHYFDNEADAFRHEIKLIAQYGRRDLRNGPLCNRTNGGEGVSGWPVSEKARKARSENLRKLFSDPEFRKAQSERMRRRNADPEFIKAKVERLRRLHADPEWAKANAERSREKMNKFNADPKVKEASAERMRKRNATAEYAKQIQERWSNPEYRTRLSAAFSKAWIKRRADRESDPAWQELKRTEKTRKKAKRRAMRKNDPIQYAKVLAAKRRRYHASKVSPPDGGKSPLQCRQ